MYIVLYRVVPKGLLNLFLLYPDILYPIFGKIGKKFWFFGILGNHFPIFGNFPPFLKFFPTKILTLTFPTPSENPDFTTDKRSPHLRRPYVAQLEIHPDRLWNFNILVHTQFGLEILKDPSGLVDCGSSTILNKNRAILICADLMWPK